ncbi:MAG: hypothetical protein OJF55_000594 [Rhodanobacteraceae bacterium]|nr:MAG: hypothetical protein OJF55_000594 [Rhodanobacteraceae bacterium]
MCPNRESNQSTNERKCTQVELPFLIHSRSFACICGPLFRLCARNPHE